MKTFVVKSVTTINKETAVQARSVEQAKALVKSGSAVAVPLATRVSNTVASVTELDT